MSPEALAAERLARRFGLTYLSAEGYAKLARLLTWTMVNRAWQPANPQSDLITVPPPQRIG